MCTSLILDSALLHCIRKTQYSADSGPPLQGDRGEGRGKEVKKNCQSYTIIIIMARLQTNTLNFREERLLTSSFHEGHEALLLDDLNSTVHRALVLDGLP
jgi:hypothetical protein